MTGRRRRLGAVGAGTALFLGAAGAASAYVELATTATGAATHGATRATSLPAGPAAQASASGVTSSDVSTTFTPLGPVGGVALEHRVRRYEAPTPATTAATAAGELLCPASPCTTTGVPDGAWVFAVVPGAGQWRGEPGPASSSVLVDRTAPSTSASGVPAGWSNASSVDVVVTADDSNAQARPSSTSVAGIASITTTVGGAGPATGSWTSPYAPSRTRTVSVSAEGQTVVAWSAADAYGNASPASSATVRLDRVAPTQPTTTLDTAPTYGTGGQRTTWPGSVGGGSAADALSGLGAVQLAITITLANGTTQSWGGPGNGYSTAPAQHHDLPGCSVQASGAWSCPFPTSYFSSVTNRDHVLSLRTRDEAGNTSVVATATVKWRG